MDFHNIERKWQQKWEEKKIFKARPKGKKYTNIEMLPYPSALGLHMGHARNYIIGDVNARYKRLQGFSVLYPMGYDSFGLPAENAAIKEGIHPKIYTEKAIKNYIRQQKALGLSYDWDRILMTHEKEYYKWDQWIFLQFLKNKLAYKKKSPVNWCSQCNTVLANEQVTNGFCWRHPDNPVEIKELDQWFFKTTDYADELLKDLEKLNWPEKIKEMQRNWIGKSNGVLIKFKIKDANEIIQVFTTRPDTICGVTFLAFSSQHPKIQDIIANTRNTSALQSFINKALTGDKYAETEKEGIFTGKYAINPITNEDIPIFIANFVLYEYGTGIIMAVPAHDQRDYEFAKKYSVPIKTVIQPREKQPLQNQAYVGDGILVNSHQFNGLENKEAIKQVAKFLKKNKLGKETTQYKLRDWLISRQRYWGAPIPIIYCTNCGIVPVPEKDLPVILPESVDFKTGGNPLATNEKFVNVKCPKCHQKAKRETDTMDTFVDSSWYFLKYCSPKSKKIFDNEVNFWMPIDMYIGGREHATGHLIYFRFFTKVMKDLGLLKISEPALTLYNHGDVNKDGLRMSKSRGNVVDPLDTVKKYSADTLRFFIILVSSPDKTLEWDERGIEGSHKFLKKTYSLLEKKLEATDKLLQNKMHRAIKEVTENIEEFKLNNTVIKLMEYVDFLNKRETISKESLEVICKLLNPFCPHLTEEMWEKLGNKNFLALQKWPKYNERYIDDELEFTEELIENTKKDIEQVFKLIQRDGKVALFVAEEWKYSFFKKLKKEIEKTREFKEILEKVKDKDHIQEIVKLIQAVLKDSSKLPRLILSQEKELAILKQAGFHVIKSEESQETKAKQAIPGKPAILVK